MKRIKGLRQLKLNNLKVVYRSDLNVPLEGAEVKDDYKLLRVADSLRYLHKQGAKTIIISHLGRPEPGADNAKYSLAPVSSRLAGIIRKPITFVPDIDGFAAATAVAKMRAGDFVMLENLRFDKNEKKNNHWFARRLAKLGDIYVNDAFAVSHRADASVSAVKDYLPSYAGPLLSDEIFYMEKALQPKKPLILIVGGAKLSTKLPVIRNYLKKADYILVGGAIANNFLSARGYEIGRSIADPKSVAAAKKLTSGRIILPVDIVVGSKLNGWQASLKNISMVGKNEYIFDIGPKTIRLFSSYIKQAQTIIWNGPMGYFENEKFRHGTMAVARLVASRSRGRAFGVVGGGETVEALRKSQMEQYVDWVSTGGGAMLDYLGGKKMPGLSKIIS